MKKSEQIKPINNNKIGKDKMSRPNETGGIVASGHIKIFDPNTQEILVQMRGDN